MGRPAVRERGEVRHHMSSGFQRGAAESSSRPCPCRSVRATKASQDISALANRHAGFRRMKKRSSASEAKGGRLLPGERRSLGLGVSPRRMSRQPGRSLSCTGSASSQSESGMGRSSFRCDRTPQRRSPPQTAQEQRRQIMPRAASGLRHLDKRLRIPSDRGRILLKRCRREDRPPEPRTLSLQCRRRRTLKAATGHFLPHHSGAACPAARANRCEHRRIRNPPPMRPGGSSSILIPRQAPGNGEAGSCCMSP